MARCKTCRGAGYSIIRQEGVVCATCQGTGQVNASKEIPPANRALVRKRSGGICEICHVQPATDVHHRQYRSRGGSHDVENLIDACGPGNVFGCHGRAHGADPLPGTTVSRYNVTPLSEIPFTDRRGDRWTLLPDGRKERVR